MNAKSQIKILILAAALASSSAWSQEVTADSTSPTPAWRAINGQVYNLLSVPSVKIPTDFSYQVIGFNGVPGQPIVLQGFAQGNPPQSVTFRNFPYNPNDFSPVHGANGLQPSHALYCRALKTSDVTNWNVLGQPISVDVVYDCGAPVARPALLMPTQ